MLENDEKCIELVMQDILKLIEERSLQINHSKISEQNKILHVIINFNELTSFYNKEILLNALHRLRILDYKWIRFKNEDDSYGEKLLHFIDLIAFSKERMRFETSYFFLTKLKKVQFNLKPYYKISNCTKSKKQ